MQHQILPFLFQSAGDFQGCAQGNTRLGEGTHGDAAGVILKVEGVRESVVGIGGAGGGVAPDAHHLAGSLGTKVGDGRQGQLNLGIPKNV